MSVNDIEFMRRNAQRGIDSEVHGLQRYLPYFSARQVLDLIEYLERNEARLEEALLMVAALTQQVKDLEHKAKYSADVLAITLASRR